MPLFKNAQFYGSLYNLSSVCCNDVLHGFYFVCHRKLLINKGLAIGTLLNLFTAVTTTPELQGKTSAVVTPTLEYEGGSGTVNDSLTLSLRHVLLTVPWIFS